MAGSAVSLAQLNNSIFAVSSRIGDEYAWMKRVSIEWHTALGTVNATMAANLFAYGMTGAPDQQAVIQVINDVDQLIAVIEGTNSTASVPRSMVVDLAAVQGVS